jgi:hypothetical protein
MSRIINAADIATAMATAPGKPVDLSAAVVTLPNGQQMTLAALFSPSGLAAILAQVQTGDVGVGVGGLYWDNGVLCQVQP